MSKNDLTKHRAYMEEAAAYAKKQYDIAVASNDNDGKFYWHRALQRYITSFAAFEFFPISVACEFLAYTYVQKVPPWMTAKNALAFTEVRIRIKENYM